jgi:hypothetical protein
MKLNGWQRIGVILSMLWVVSIASYVAYEYRKGSFSSSIFIEVVASKTGESMRQFKTNQFSDLIPVETKLKYHQILYCLFLPLLLSWLGVYLVVYFYKWIAAGFKNNNR